MRPVRSRSKSPHPSHHKQSSHCNVCDGKGRLLLEEDVSGEEDFYKFEACAKCNKFADMSWYNENANDDGGCNESENFIRIDE
jgi:hypothetical protein